MATTLKHQNYVENKKSINRTFYRYNAKHSIFFYVFVANNISFISPSDGSQKLPCPPIQYNASCKLNNNNNGNDNNNK